MLSYLFLAYNGNYAYRDEFGYEYWTYNGNLYMVDPVNDIVMLD